MRALVAAVVVVAAWNVTQPAPAIAKGSGYAVVARDSVGGPGGWDLLTLDPSGQRLYFGRGNRVQVFGTREEKVLGEVQGTSGVHGIAVAGDLGMGFTSNGRDSTVTEFDLGTLAVVRRISIGARNPDAIIYEPVSRRVFAMNAGSASATAIDAATGEVAGTVALGGQPEFAVADEHGRVFVNLEDSSAVVSFDARTLQLGPRWSLGEGEGPTGLAIDVAHRRLFATCANRKMVVLDADRGTVVTTLPIGEGSDAAAFDPGTQLAFSSNGAGTLTVVHEISPDRYEVLEEVPTQRGARTMALDPGTHRIYLAAAKYGEAPAPTADRPHPRPPMLPDSFVILVLGRGGK